MLHNAIQTHRHTVMGIGATQLASIACCLAVLFCGTAWGQGSSEDWISNPANGHSYRLTAETTWVKAQEQAVAWGGYLTTINDAAENAWLQSTFASTDTVFIGANDRDEEGVWRWVEDDTVFWSGGTPTPGMYTNWNANEPNDSGGEDIGELIGGTGVWNDNGAYSVRFDDIQKGTTRRGVVEYNRADVDQDGLWDDVETDTGVYISPTDTGTSSEDDDSDDDGLPDGWEVQYGLNPNAGTGLQGADGNPDVDSVVNSDEYVLGTDPLDADTDNDGLTDYQEWQGTLGYATDPTDADSDDDGLADGAEVNVYGTSPLEVHSDADNLPDGWEADNDLDPAMATGIDGDDGDFDSDGATNLAEYTNGTAANDPDTDDDTYLDGAELAAGSDPLDPAMNPTNIPPLVTYSLGDATELLDMGFYDPDPPDAASGRMGFFGNTSNDGKTVAFWAVDVGTMDIGVFLTDIGYPDSWRRLGPNWPTLPDKPVIWSPDDNYVLANGYRIDVDTGVAEPHTLFGCVLDNFSVTRSAADNWLVINRNSQLAALPVLPDCSEDPSRAPVILTDFNPAEVDALWPAIAPDGASVAFMDYQSTDGEPDTSDTYLLTNLADIINTPKRPGTDVSSLAPTTLSAPNILAIRSDETEHFCAPADFSQDSSITIYSEDWNGVFRDDDFFPSLVLSDFDIMISNTDGSGDDARLASPGNQAVVTPTPGGTRLVYINDALGKMHLYITTLEVNTEVKGTIVGAPEDNDVLTDAELEATDTCGTVVIVPDDTVVDFPPSTPQVIEMSTPVDPAETPELPEGVEGVPVLREFGPSGTTFSQPIEVTIAYTDAEVAGFDEFQLRVFLYNDETGLFDIAVDTVIHRDLENNTITFTTDHFSIYGLGQVNDTDGDGLLDHEDPDDDNDGVLDGEDPYPLDTDDDGVDNAQDTDDDADGIADVVDAYPLDTDNDGLRNDVDADDDNDGILDADEDGITEFLFDTDNDGLRNDVDEDDDGDGIADEVELFWGFDPIDPSDVPELPAAWPWLALAALALVGVRSLRRAFHRG